MESLYLRENGRERVKEKDRERERERERFDYKRVSTMVRVNENV